MINVAFAVAVGGAVLVFCLALKDGLRKRALHDDPRAVNVKATVRFSEANDPFVDYTVAGHDEKMVKLGSMDSEPPRDGATLDIRVDPAAPDQPIYASETGAGMLALSGLMLLCALLFAGGWLWLALSPKRAARARKGRSQYFAN